MRVQTLRHKRSNWQDGWLIDLAMPPKYSGKKS
jgi:hypothetical protein